MYTALLIASKMWEDLGIGNIDFMEVYPYYPLKSINYLERFFAD